MCEYYFTFPDLMVNEHPDEYKIVDEWVKRTDPNFNPSNTLEARRNIILETQ